MGIVAADVKPAAPFPVVLHIVIISVLRFRTLDPEGAQPFPADEFACDGIDYSGDEADVVRTTLIGSAVVGTVDTVVCLAIGVIAIVTEE